LVLDEHGAITAFVLTNTVLSVDRGELLEASHLLEPEHGPLSSPEWLMRVFGTVVCPPRGFLSAFVSNDLHDRSI